MKKPPLPKKGWYPDPDDETQQRFWDGREWTTHTAPNDSLPTPMMPESGLPISEKTDVQDNTDMTTMQWDQLPQEEIERRYRCFKGRGSFYGGKVVGTGHNTWLRKTVKTGFLKSEVRNYVLCWDCKGERAPLSQ